MSPLRFGTLACSSIARRRFLPALKATPRAELVRIGSRDPARAAEFARPFPGTQTGTYQEVLDDPQVQAVYISTPVTTHEEWILKAAARGKHVLCEKPALMSYASAKRCAEVFREKDLILMEAYSFGYHPQHALIRDLAATPEFGALRFVEAQFTYPRPPQGDIRLNPELAGGVFHDAAGYPVAAALAAFQALPTSVYTLFDFAPPTGVDNAVAITMRFPEGQTAHCYAGMDLFYRSRYALLGSRGRIEAHRAFSVLPNMVVNITFEQADRVETLQSGPVDQFQLMIEEFVKTASDNSRRNRITGALLNQHLVMDAALRSQREQRPVDLSEILQ